MLTRKQIEAEGITAEAHVVTGVFLD